ncbi:MAG: FAD-dependent oxidoreductase [Ponticaulis sp.]|nr:FAD-dependent oxidoreductase [Ponticaulis sp.]
MSVWEIETVVVGAGVVGLAIAEQLSRQGREVLLIERASAIATETTSRNSEVIHAGLYYPTGSKKARFCVRGRHLLYDWLPKHGIDHKACGKLVVATDEGELDALAALKVKGQANEVEGLELLSGREARVLEPELSEQVCAALLSPTSGIFDSHSFCHSLLGKIEDRGGQLALNSEVLRGAVTPSGVVLIVGGEEETRLRAQWVVNAAGHRAPQLAGCIDGPHQTGSLPTPYFAKGVYFSIQGRPPFTRLIYPMPTSASLGIHYTLDLSGSGRLGPDVEWLLEGSTPPFDYAVDPGRASAFLKSAQTYWPELRLEQLSPTYSGVRPKLVYQGEDAADFCIESQADHGSAGLINLFGIESPGLTSSLAIGEYVAELVQNDL